MKKSFFFTAILMLVLASCGGPNPITFNDSIVNQEKELEVPLTEYINKAMQEISTGSYDKAKVLGDSMILKIDKSIEVIKVLDTPKNGEKFKEVAIQYFESAKELVSFVNKAQSLGAEPTQEQYEAYYKEYEKIMKTVNDKTNDYMGAQKEFAKENNIILK